MDIIKIRAKVAELRKAADELEALIPQVIEEDIILCDDDFLEEIPAEAIMSFEAPVKVDFQKDINDAIERILCG